MIKALGRIRTESQHTVSTNADTARSEISSLNGMNTSSKHTIYVSKVETDAAGGLVGAGVRHFASGGAVASAFARMSGGSVPGSGNQDSVARSLDAGAFVLRKAAVQKYGSTALSRLANGVARFASGGAVVPNGRAPVKRNRDVAEAKKMMELGLQGTGDYAFWLRMHYGANVDVGFEWGQGQYYGRQADIDRRALEALAARSKLTSVEQQEVNTVKQHWLTPMAQPQLWGKDLERDLLDYMEQNQAQFFASGGVAKSDSVEPVVSSVSYLITGALLVQSATREAGRAITLVGAADMAWFTRSNVKVLHEWAALPLDAVTGRFELTLHDTYMGSNIIVSEPPVDPNVSVTLFSTLDAFDRRDAASARVESYLTKGPMWGGMLLENHIAGQRAVQILQSVDAELPRIGQTLVLVQNEGSSNEKSQYIRTTEVSVVERKFEDCQGRLVDMNVVTCSISDALRTDFQGSEGNAKAASAAGATRVRDTTVAERPEH